MQTIPVQTPTAGATPSPTSTPEQQQGTAVQTPPAPGSGSPASSTQTATTDGNPWADQLASLPPELKQHIEKAGYADLQTLIKSDMEAQRMIGADKATLLRMPKGSRADDPAGWAAVDKVLGVPDDGKYAEWKPEQGEFAAQPEQVAQFDKMMHEAGAPQKVRDAALRALHEINHQIRTETEKVLADERAAHQAQLQKDWGMMAPVRLAEAQKALDGVDGEAQFKALLARAGIADHPITLRVMGALAAERGESGVPDAGATGGGAGGVPNAAAALAKRSALMADQAFVQRYRNGDPAATQEMLALNSVIAGANLS